jgi:hypothetical protein
MKNNVKNGNALSNTGHRQILFSATGELRPVAFAVDSGYQPDRGTVQVAPRAGDLIARVDWCRRGEEYTIARATGDGDCAGDALPLNDQAPAWALLKNRHPWLDGWLAPVGRGPSYLPAEAYGGVTLAAAAKRDRCEAAIRRYGLPVAYSQEWAISPKTGINTRPEPLNFDPDAYQASAKSWTGSVVGICRRERFFSSAGNGAAVELFPVLQEEHGSNYAHETPSWAEGQPGIPGWNSQRYLIRLITGAYTRDHHSYGVMMDVWETTQAVALAA